MPGGAQGAELPATFTVTGTRVSPPTVSAPAFIAVALTVVSGDGRPHRAVIATSPAHTLNVPGGGRAAVLLAGLRDGRYAIALDGGRARATLIVGAEPGP